MANAAFELLEWVIWS